MTNSAPLADKDLTSKEFENETNNKPFFSAVGVVRGKVNFGEDGVNTVSISGKNYRFRYASGKGKALQALKLQIKKTGNNEQRLIVYPRIIHFPNREKPYIIYFELIGFENLRLQKKSITSELNDLEFKLFGLWQFIPVCRTPCISVFRNFSEERKLFIKEAEPLVKVRFMKAAHLPLLWKESPVQPFRFNPRLSKEEQGRSKFVQLKARFLPQRDAFGFVEQLAEPLDEPPKFLKASKADKAEQRKNAAPTETQKPDKKNK